MNTNTNNPVIAGAIKRANKAVDRAKRAAKLVGSDYADKAAEEVARAISEAKLAETTKYQGTALDAAGQADEAAFTVEYFARKSNS